MPGLGPEEYQPSLKFSVTWKARAHVDPEGFAKVSEDNLWSGTHLTDTTQ